MTDTPPPAPPPQSGPDAPAGLPTTPGGPNIRILAQFTRDFSFENPRAPDALREPGQPQIELGVEMGAQGRADGLFEIDLKLSVTATREGRAAFQVELVYGGLFEVQGVPEEHIEPVLLVECPRFLFPFARRIIADATGEGGFPPFLLEPIDFAAVYASQRLQKTAGNA